MTTETTTAVLDVRTYRLVNDGRAELDRLFRERSLPMLRRYGIEVVAYGPSLVDDYYCLIRAFTSSAQRAQQLNAFYGSQEWVREHQDAVMALMEDYQVAAIPLTVGNRNGLARTATMV